MFICVRERSAGLGARYLSRGVYGVISMMFDPGVVLIGGE